MNKPFENIPKTNTKSKTAQTSPKQIVEKVNNAEFRSVSIVIEKAEYCNIFAEKNNKTLKQTLEHPKYAKFRTTVGRQYQCYLDKPLGEFLLILKNLGDLFYKRFLNPYGDEIFCRFFINTPDILKEKGIYSFWLKDEIVYIGRCLDSFNKRINQGYGKIQPKNCFIDGQATNCHVNSLIAKTKEEFQFRAMIMQNESKIISEESSLIATVKPRWNIQLR